MYDTGPSQEELDAIGIRREDVEDTSDFDVWPENWVPYKVFSEVHTQWRAGMGGPTGLDYGPVQWAMDLHQVPKKKHLEVLRAIRTMESSALKQMRKT